MFIRLCIPLTLLYILLLSHTIQSQRFSDDFFRSLYDLIPEDRPNYHPVLDSDIFAGLALAYDKIDRYIARQKNAIPHLFPAEKVEYYDEHSDIVADLMFHSRLARTVNCRRSLDNWDCEDCEKVLPDAQVVRTFGTYPLDIVGQVVVSKEKKTIYVVIRGANSARNHELARVVQLVDHNFIPKAKVHRGAQIAVEDIKDIINDTLNMQTRLHPTFRIHVVGHSFGAAIASLLTVEIHNNVTRATNDNLSGYFIGKPRVGDEMYAQYVRDNNFDMKRMNHLSDSIPNAPAASEDGYTHEGTEYWEYAIEPSRLLKCVGARESRDCINTIEKRNILDHMM
ncbi:alpha/beta-hydrolase [Backusella circina FSU 941]|nr:alpha/beta-hydrolase [Backusella circina FSU 941]